MSVEVKNLYKSFEKKNGKIEVLKGINLFFEDKKMYLIKGASGKGKTTLLTMIGLLDSPSEGEIIVDGKHVEKLPEKELCKIRRDKYAFVFQDYGLLENLTVYENMNVQQVEMSDKLGEKECEEILEKLNMLHRKNHKVMELSGGEKQRAAFARALVKKSDVFICDEPISNIDEENADVIRELLMKIKEDRTVILTCHTNFFDDICDEIIRL